jgi:hypothetical protein
MGAGLAVEAPQEARRAKEAALVEPVRIQSQPSPPHSPRLTLQRRL